ncbi:MAG TPA: aminotransferase class III-fold pyridoxal phosphate-dependent enzyme [Acidimicrobiales bacterium]
MSPSAFLHPFARPAATVDEFRTIVRGEGATVWDAEGRAYVDVMASLWYCAIGHGRPEMVKRISEQLATLEAYHCFDMFTNEPAEQFCALVAERVPVPGARVFLTSSGSEAIDTAVKLSRLTFSLAGQPSRHLVVGRHGGYHGVTYGGLSAQGLDANQLHFGPLLEGVARVDRHEVADLEALFGARGTEIAALLVEPVQGAGGVHPPAPGYLERARELCSEHGALLVFDEVITGFGRLGSWFAADVYGVEPDLITFAKGATSGYLPLGGVVVGRAVLDVLEADPAFVLRHGFTYSGHPTACAAGIGNVEILEEERLFERVPVIAERLGGGLASLVADGLLAGRRGTGAVWAAVLPDRLDALAVRDSMLADGVIARPIGDVIAFCPPLVITDDQLDRCLAALAAALRAP